MNDFTQLLGDCMHKKNIYYKNSIRKKGFLILFFIIFLIVGCENDKITPIKSTGEISYTTTIQPIFSKSCLGADGGCHSFGGISPDLSIENSYSELIENNYIDTVNAKSSLLYRKVEKGESMSTFITSSELDQLLMWIEQGAKNN